MTSPRMIACIFLATLALGCNPPAEQPMTSDERAAIADEVHQLFNGIAEATNALDLDRLLGYYRQSDDLTYVAQGRVNRSYETHQEMVNTQFGGLAGSELEWLSAYVDVLSRDVVVVTATYEFNATLPSGRSIGSAGTFSCIYVLGDGVWQIHHSSHTFPAATG